MATAANTHADPDNLLGRYQWKNRLLLVSVARAESAASLTEAWRANAAGVTDRDLLLLDLSIQPSLSGAIRPDDKEIKRLRKELGLGAEDEVLLIGKDGGVKSRDTIDKFHLQDCFTRIDAMPMRKTEIREKRSE